MFSYDTETTGTDPDPKTRFSHAMYDDLTEILFLYFEGGTILNLGQADDKELLTQHPHEFCIYLDPIEYERMRNYFLERPTKESV